MSKRCLSIVILYCLFSPNESFAQNEKADSLLQSLEIAEADTTQVNIYAELGMLYIYSDIEKTKTYAEKALEISEKADYQKGIANAYRQIGFYYLFTSNYPVCIENTVKSMELAKQIGSTNIVASCANTLGMVYRELEAYDQALEYFFAAEKIYKEQHHDLNLIRTSLNIAALYRLNKDYDIAKKYLSECESLLVKHGDDKLLGNFHYEYGTVLYKLGEYDKVEKEAFMAADYFSKVNSAYDLANTYDLLGMLYNKLNRPKEALEQYEKAFAIYEQKNYQSGLMHTYMNYASSYNLLSDYRRSKEYANLAITKADEIGEHLSTRYAYTVLEEVSEKQGEYKKALEYNRKIVQLKDSIYNKEKSKQIANLEILHETEKREAKIELLTKQTEYESNLRKVIIALAVLIVLSLLLFINRVRMRNRLLAREKQLETEKSELLKADLDTKNRELTSFTLNMIQKNELLQTLREHLKKATKEQDYLKSALKLVKSNINLEKDWESLKLHFEQVHPDFFDKLISYCPDLTPNDLRLCSYVKLRLPNKEVARMMNIDSKSIHMSHYRIKKKLQLDKDIDLAQFIGNLN